MTTKEFGDLGAYLQDLWPMFTLNVAQSEIWFRELGHLPVDVARQAVQQAYVDSKWKEPYLALVLEALKALRKLEPAKAPPEIPQDEALAMVEQHWQAMEARYAKLGIPVAKRYGPDNPAPSLKALKQQAS